MYKDGSLLTHFEKLSLLTAIFSRIDRFCLRFSWNLLTFNQILEISLRIFSMQFRSTTIEISQTMHYPIPGLTLWLKHLFFQIIFFVILRSLESNWAIFLNTKKICFGKIAFEMQRTKILLSKRNYRNIKAKNNIKKLKFNFMWRNKAKLICFD